MQTALRSRADRPSPARSDAEQLVLDAIDREATVTLLREMVRARSENPPGGEAEVVEVLARMLDAAGIPSETDLIAPGRPNLAATLEMGAGPTLMLNGHTDTVPLGEGWSVDPLGGEVRDGHLYGRGSADMKAGIAAMTAAMIAVRRSGVSLSGTVILDAVTDEEHGSRGARRLVEAGRKATYAVITEPSELRVQRVGNGLVYFDVTFLGVAAHGSTPESGHSAIMDAAAFIQLIEKEAEELRSAPHPLTGPATYNVGIVDGGIDTSIVPARCRVVVDRRVIPGQSTQGAEEDMRRILGELQRMRPEARFEYSVFSSLEPVAVDEDNPLCRELLGAINDVTGEERGFSGMRATSNAPIFAAAGIPTIVFGPGSIFGAAHKPDERVPLDEVHAATDALALTIVRLLAS